MRNSNKTLWQKFYSFFGFWTYTMRNANESKCVVYWCFFPGMPFYRKFDLFSFNI